MVEVIRVQCTVCGKISVGRVPKGGTGDERYPRRHYDANGSVCEGIYIPGIWLEGIPDRRPGGADA